MITSEDKTSFEVLCDIQEKNDTRFKSSAFKDVAQKTVNFWKKEFRFFKKKWHESDLLKDSDLVAELKNIQKNIFEKADGTQLLDKFFKFASQDGEIGVEYVVAQDIAELFGENQGTELLIFRDNSEFEWVDGRVSKLMRGSITTEEMKELNKFIVDHKITIFSKDIITELGLAEAGTIEKLNNLRCLQLESSIL